MLCNNKLLLLIVAEILFYKGLILYSKHNRTFKFIVWLWDENIIKHVGIVLLKAVYDKY